MAHAATSSRTRLTSGNIHIGDYNTHPCPRNLRRNEDGDTILGWTSRFRMPCVMDRMEAGIPMRQVVVGRANSTLNMCSIDRDIL
jgi:hypothetical protein